MATKEQATEQKDEAHDHRATVEGAGEGKEPLPRKRKRKGQGKGEERKGEERERGRHGTHSLMTSSSMSDIDDNDFLMPYGKPTSEDQRPPLRRKPVGSTPAGEVVKDTPEEVVDELMDILDGCPINLQEVDIEPCESIREWTMTVREVFKQGTTFESGASHLCDHDHESNPAGKFRSFLLHGCTALHLTSTAPGNLR